PAAVFLSYWPIVLSNLMFYFRDYSRKKVLCSAIRYFTLLFTSRKKSDTAGLSALEVSRILPVLLYKHTDLPVRLTIDSSHDDHCSPLPLPKLPPHDGCGESLQDCGFA